MQSKIQLDSIEEAIQDIKNGKVVIVVDDEDRENEGDFICAAEKITPEIINFMRKEGGGLICAPLSEELCDHFSLDMMVKDNTALHETPFTVSIDLLGHGCTTGISAHDRAQTILALTNKETKPEELGRPGHIFPLRARNGGVLRRVGHTEAAIDLSRLAGLASAGVLVEIMDENGQMARLPRLREIADKFGLKLISIEDLIKYRLQHDSLIKKEVEVDMPTAYGHFKMVAFKQLNTEDVHLAMVKGEWEENEPIMVRVHSSCVTGDIFGSERCDCGEQLHAALQMIEKEGKGVLLYMKQEGRGIGLINKLKAYKLQEQGYDTVEANHKLGFKTDERDYGVGAQILKELGIQKMRLISNNPKKRAGLAAYGIEVVESVDIEIEPNENNIRYLSTKRDKMGHHILLESVLNSKLRS